MSRVILVYWDQLTEEISSIASYRQGDLLVFIECKNQATYVKHHKKKLVFLFSAMRHFAKKIAKKYQIEYFKLDNSHGLNTTDKCINYINQQHKVDELVITHPGEYHQLSTIKKIAKSINCKLIILEDNRFICSKQEFNTWIKNKKNNQQIIMESFYRLMRQKTGILINDNKPTGGKWNFDKENRNAIPNDIEIPNIKGFKISNITKEVIKLVKDNFSDHFGDIYPFGYAVTHQDAEKALNIFIEIFLPNFGLYQDAMVYGEAFLFHSVLSQYINVGLLAPIEVCKRVEIEYHSRNIDLACAEGFIRQIIGWREYIRGIYWHYMPKYLKLNEMDYNTKLPDLYWGEKTNLRCISHTINETIKHGYSHHIQRLMITGNFATLIGVKPKDIHQWYLIVYMDAFEWVELPNTIGMATFADGGIVGTKPYISGGNYINKMSNFCNQCKYKVQQKSGSDACPFNYLYWNYLITHFEKIKSNHRLRMPLNTLSKMPADKIKQIKNDSKIFLEKISQGEIV